LPGTGAGRRSRCESFAELIAAKVASGFERSTDYQDLVKEKDFSDSYQSYSVLFASSKWRSRSESGAWNLGLEDPRLLGKPAHRGAHGQGDTRSSSLNGFHGHVPNGVSFEHVRQFCETADD